MDGFDPDINTDLTTQSILLAAAHHDVPALRDLLRNSTANIQDPDTGFTPLHAAIAALEPEGDDIVSNDTNGTPATGNGDANGTRPSVPKSPSEDEMAAAGKTVKFLLQSGAIWNDLDANNETAGCIADRLGLKELYDLMVDAGVRAELLLGRLDEYEPLSDQDDEEGDEEDEEVNEKVEEAEGFVEDDSKETSGAGDLTEEHIATNATNGNVTEETANGMSAPVTDVSVNNATYLANTVHRNANGELLDASDNGVMMAWEGRIMTRSAELLVRRSGLRVLNIGHGLGLIDDEFQDLYPSDHYIVEAHPAVLAKMREQGWYEKPGVKIFEGRWQDVMPKIIESGETFDAIYFDTFAEDYKALREFFSEHVVGILEADRGRFGFFNGMGADRKISYDVYQKVVEMDLFEAGFDVDWEELEIADLAATGQWEGVRRPYWTLPTYRLPTCSFMS